jgi:hypothetical protein
VVPAALTAAAVTAGIKSIPVIGTTLGVMTRPRKRIGRQTPELGG